MLSFDSYADRTVRPSLASAWRAAQLSAPSELQSRFHASDTAHATVARFQARYTALVGGTSLVPPDDRFERYAQFAASLGVSVEDYVDDVLSEGLRSQLTRLAACGAAAARFAVPLVDWLLAAAVVPACVLLGPHKHDTELHYDYTAELTRHWIQGLAPELLVECVKEMRLACLGGANVGPLLAGLDWEAYAGLTVAQGVAHAALVNVSGPALRAEVRDAPLVRAVVASPHLACWMLACSSMDEQYWLNTCEVAARNAMAMARLPTVAHLLVVTRHQARHLRRHHVPRLAADAPWVRTLWGGCWGVRSVRAHCEAVLAAVEAELDALEARVRAQLLAGPPDEGELQQLVLDWNRAAQHLSSVFDPEEPVVLSRKLFSDRWQLSARVTALPCLLGSLLPGQPWVLARNAGALGRYERGPPCFVWRDTLSPQAFPQFQNLTQTLRGASAEAARALLLELWAWALHYGGLHFASKEHIFGVEVGHLNGLFAVRLPSDGSQHFLVCDPEVHRFKWLTLDQMRDMVVGRTNFDLFDV